MEIFSTEDVLVKIPLAIYAVDDTVKVYHPCFGNIDAIIRKNSLEVGNNFFRNWYEIMVFPIEIGPYCYSVEEEEILYRSRMLILEILPGYGFQNKP